MTSSEKHFHIGPSRWDYNIQNYKPSRDVFFEKGLISVIFLACGRPQVTRRSFLSTLDSAVLYNDEIEWVFIENGRSDDNAQFFESLMMPRKVILRQNNYGINEGLNQGWAISRGEFIMIHENDWECRGMFNFLSVARDILQEKPDVGILQLRAIHDPCENWGLNKPMYNPWSCDRTQLGNVKVYDEVTSNRHKYLIGTGFYGFNNNPTIIRKKLYRECGPYPECELGTDPRHGETLYQEEVLKTGCAIAHIGQEIYYHIGQQTTQAN